MSFLKVQLLIPDLRARWLPQAPTDLGQVVPGGRA